jgi:ankyrin repeat protein
MPFANRPPARTLARHPDLAQLKRQAKELLTAFEAGHPEAIAEIARHYRGATAETFALHHAQLVLARSYGFDSWPKLKAYVDGVTVGRLIDAVRAGDVDTVRAMLSLRPELAHMDASENDEHRALHHAVLQRRPAIVTLLMDHGADAHKGIWPHRDATSPLTMAIERDDTEIVDIIREAESRRQGRGEERTVAPSEWLPLRNAEGTARWAVATGNADWLRARHAQGSLPDESGLISLAVTSRRPEVLRLLLEFGFDPDERERVGGLEEVVPSSGGPLRECARTGNTVQAQILLEHGANPNTNVYAASSAMYEALARQDSTMVQLLEKHGGIVNATTAAFLGFTDRVRQLFEDEKSGRLHADAVPPGGNVTENVLEAATDAGHVGLVRMALEHLDWLPSDGRWQGALMRPLGRHKASDRDRYVECFRMIVDRSGIDLPWRFGRTLLHDVAANWPRTAPMGADDRLAFARILLEKGAPLDARDDLLKSTPLGWACRWGHAELVNLLLAHGADPNEADAEPWATPRAWAEKMDRREVLAILGAHSATNGS